MQKLFFLVALFFLSLEFSNGQYYEDKDVSEEPYRQQKRFETESWKTAYVVPKGQLHLSLLAPIRYGLLPSLELQSNLALWGYLTPNLSLKKNWYKQRLVISSKHGLYYPSLGLKRLKDDGKNSTLNKDAVVPQICTFQNELIVSYLLNPSCVRENPHWIATARLGGDFSIVEERDKSFNRMTFYSLFHRTASFYGDMIFYAGLQFDGGLSNRIYFNLGADVYAIGTNFLSGIEAQGALVYHYNHKLSISLGAKYIKTDNFIEKESHLLPTVDICYRLFQKTWQRGLFGKE